MSARAHWRAAGRKKPSTRPSARVRKEKNGPPRGARGDLGRGWPARARARARTRKDAPLSAAPLRWGSSAQLCCPRFSSGSHPRGKYLAPGGEGERGYAKRKKEVDRAGRKGKTALAERRARQPVWSPQKTRLHLSRPSGLRKCSVVWVGTQTTVGLPFPEGCAVLRLLLPSAPARQAFFSVLLPRAKLQFPGGLARIGLEVGSLEVTRATGAGGVSSERRGAESRGRGARGAGSRGRPGM